MSEANNSRRLKERKMKQKGETIVYKTPPIWEIIIISPPVGSVQIWPTNLDLDKILSHNHL